MGKLNEALVRDEAMVFLKDHYVNVHKLAKISEKKEAVVVYRGKKGRVDGLLTFKDQRGRIITVAVEAKSRKTYLSLRPVFDDMRLLLLLTVVIALVFISSMIIFNMLTLWIRIVLSLLIGVISFFAFMLWAAILYKGVKRGAIDQLSRYPADLKWIALPMDLFNQYYKRKDRDDDLLEHLHAKGMGLLLVSGRGKVTIKSEPRRRKFRIQRKYSKFYPRWKFMQSELDS